MDRLVEYELNEDEHENIAIIFTPQLEGSHKILGLIEGRDFETQIFAHDKPCYEQLFEMNLYTKEENQVEKDFQIMLKEDDLEIDVYGRWILNFEF